MDRDAPVANDAQSFCRQARRLRADLASDPVRMHRQLGRLSIKEPARLQKVWRLGRKGMTVSGGGPRGLSVASDDAEGDRYTLLDPIDPVPEAEGYPSTTDRSFGDYVHRTLAPRPGGVLRYSERLAMLKEAGARGIARFEANLIIASVQHRLQITSPPMKRARRRRFALTGVLAFLGVQGMILLGYWRMLRS